MHASYFAFGLVLLHVNSDWGRNVLDRIIIKHRDLFLLTVHVRVPSNAQ